MKLTPTSAKSFNFAGGVGIANAGRLDVKGGLNLDFGQWRIEGQMNEVVAGDRLLELAASASPQVRDRLVQAQRQMRVAATKLRGETVRLASSDQSAFEVQSGNETAFGIAGLLDIRFDAVAKGDGSGPEFRVLLGLRDGTVNNGVLPFTLNNVNAQFYRDNKQVFLDIQNAKNDETQLNLEASIGTDANGQPVGYVKADVKDLPLDDRIRRVLPFSLKRFLKPLNATGIVSVDGTWRAVNGRWKPEGCRVDLKNGTSLFDKFRYPVKAITGSMIQRSNTNEFDIKLRGLASEREVTMTGWLKNPGPTAESSLTILGEGIPLDETFRAAFDERGREVVDKLGMNGTADGTIIVHREPVFGAKPTFSISAHIRDGRMNYVDFPYPLERVSGFVTYTSKFRSWTFRDFEGFQNDTRITADGKHNGESVPGRMKLKFAATNGRITNGLRGALNGSLQQLWDHLAPTGRFDMDFDIDWIAETGQPVFVTVPRFRLRDGGLRPASFPYQLEAVQAELSYVPGTRERPQTGQLTIKKAIAKHGGTNIAAAGWATHETNGDWKLHFTRLDAKNVVANSDLLLALPESLREAFQVLNPTAPFSMGNTELEFRGKGNPNVPITAAWRSETLLTGGSISAGMDLRNVRGRVTNQGTYGPQGLRNEGDVELSSVEVLEHKLTGVRGPYRIVDNQLWIGAPEVFRQTPATVPVNKRITADAFDGQLTCDARVSLSDQSRYQVFCTVTDASLKTYAGIHMPAERNMSGRMNGWIHLHGTGEDEANIKGNGQLQISPAAIYEMPVMVNLLQALGTLNFAVSDPVAFRHALLNFRVQDRKFRFDQIDLVGNAMSLRGRGYVGFDERVSLDFYSKPPRTPGSIPIISRLVSGATSGWVNVKVGGTLDKPKTSVQPSINNALPFLQTFDPANRPQIRAPF